MGATTTKSLCACVDEAPPNRLSHCQLCDHTRSRRTPPPRASLTLVASRCLRPSATPESGAPLVRICRLLHDLSGEASGPAESLPGF